MTTYTTRPPANRMEALRDLEHVAALAFHAMGCDQDPELRAAAIKQLRCDLHVLGVSSEELDAAGLAATERQS